MRLLSVFLIALVGPSFAAGAEEENPNQLTKEEKAAGFKLLFNGRDLEGWKQSGNWVINEGTITLKRQATEIPAALEAGDIKVVPFHAGEKMSWRLVED